jgi:ADP-heptose:LPS heptosyltransferase
MYRESQYPTWINVLFDDGGLGDCIARLPAVKFIYDNHSHVHIHLYVPDFFYDFAKSCLKGTEKRITVTKWSSIGKAHKSGYPTKIFRTNPYTNLASHMTEHAFQIICNTVPEDKNVLNYLKPDLSKISIEHFNLPNNYVVITTGYTAPVREFLPEHINAISQYVESRGFTPVFLGKKNTASGLEHVIEGSFNTEIDYSVGIDLIDKTDLFQATKICQNAKAVVGLDNGILHLAGCTDVPIVGGFTTVNPIHRMPYRNGVLGDNYYAVVPPDTLKCRFCQSNWQFTYNHEFTTCKYEDLKCLSQVEASLYISQLEKLL